MTEQRRTCIRLLLKLLNRIYETLFCNDKLLGWTRNVGGILFATRRYDIVTTRNKLIMLHFQYTLSDHNLTVLFGLLL